MGEGDMTMPKWLSWSSAGPEAEAISAERGDERVGAHAGGVPGWGRGGSRRVG